VSVCFNPRDDAFFMSGSEDKTVKKWLLPAEVYNAKNPKIMKQAKRTVVSHEKQVNVIRIAHNGRLCASGSHDKKIVVDQMIISSTIHSICRS
jgi:WD40 repeat protein